MYQPVVVGMNGYRLNWTTRRLLRWIQTVEMAAVMLNNGNGG